MTDLADLRLGLGTLDGRFYAQQERQDGAWQLGVGMVPPAARSRWRRRTRRR